MKSLSRIGVSLDSDLLKKFDAFIKRAGYIGRSEAFRDLIRARLTDEVLQNDDTEVVGVLTIVYDHHRRQLEEELTDIQHHSHHNIITTTHVHIDLHNCLEVILIRGKVSEVRQISLQLSSLKGVTQTKLSMTSARLDPHHH